MGVLNRDERRSAALLFSDELHDGQLALADLDRRDVRAAVRSRRVWSWPRRAIERKRYERRGRGYRDDSLPALQSARRAVLGDAAAGPPRLLVRVDEYPNFDALDVPEHGPDGYRAFHEVMREGGVPYLVAVQPALARHPLDPAETRGRPLDDAELALLRELRDDGVAFALHGYDHRTRTTHMPDNTELEGRDDADLGALLDRGLTFLDEQAGVRPRVLVPPYNTFSARQWPALARRFAVVTGGPESVPRMGYHRAPLFRGDAVYFPCYEPLYGPAGALLAPVRAAITAQHAVWTTITLHWEWERRDDFAALRELLAVVAPVARSWDDALAAIDAAKAHG